LVNRKFSGTFGTRCRQAFACFAEAFDHLSTAGGGSYMTRIAAYYGSGGTGLQRPGGTNPVGTNQAWGLWRLNTSTARPGGGSALGDVYFLLSGAFDTGAVSPIRHRGSTSQRGVALAVAFREDGTNPWNAVTGSMGADVTASPLWSAGGSTVHVFPLSNNPGGSYNTNKENCMVFGDYQQGRVVPDDWFHLVADADNIAAFCTYRGESSNPLNSAHWWFATSSLQPNCGSDPYFCFSGFDYDSPLGSGGYGDTAGTSEFADGGVKLPRDQVGQLYWTSTGVLGETRAPNPYSATSQYDEVGTRIYTSDAFLGYGNTPGEDDFFRFVEGVLGEWYDPTNERAALGSADVNNQILTVPWPTAIGEAPGETRTDDGVTF
jgi:hypothetical protein